MDNKYDIIVIISSYNRYELLYDLLSKLLISSKKHTLKIIVNDDGSTDERYLKLKDYFSEIDIIRSEVNKGKHGYWVTINNLLSESKKYHFKYLLTIPDDFAVCDNFIDLVVSEHESAKEKNKKVVCTTYATIRKDKRWELKHWMDGDGLFDKSFFDSINFTLDRIIPTGNRSGSGVWKQISQKINLHGFSVHKPVNIYVDHLGYSDSRMHPKLRKEKNIIIKKTI